MLSSSVFAARRRRLREQVSSPVLLMGNGERARNLPMNKLPFRQDSTFLYFTGCDLPNAAALLENGSCTLFLPRPAEDDPLWHGPTPTLDQLGEALGVDGVRPLHELEQAVAEVGGAPLTLAVPDEGVNRRVAALTGSSLAFGDQHGDDALVDAVIALRRGKDADELEEMREVAAHTAVAHKAVMRATVPGGHERGLAALFEAVLAARGCTTGYGTILTQAGEVLHNFHHTDPLEAGRLLLLDGGGELASGYGCDITRTWPVSGTYDARQRAAYEAVLEAQIQAIELCRAGVRYRDVHLRSCRVVAQFLADEGLVTVGADDAVEAGAHALFYPHGVGHLLGLDVHDLENFGDRPAYPAGASRSPQFGLSYLRLDLPLQPDWVVTVEPGFYVVPAILDDPGFRDRFAGMVDFEKAASWIGFGGIRIEDDVRITDADPEVLTASTPKAIREVEALVGTGPTVEERLS